MDLLHILIVAETGEEIDRDWFPDGTFKVKSTYSNRRRRFEVTKVKVESRDTRRVFLQEVY
jgi:transcription initiation factor IIF auxiliary subunit